MPLERRNPLPPGSYWIDVPAGKADAFDGWVKAQGGAVRVRMTSLYANGDVWVRFDTSAPVPWAGPGYPNIASPGDTSPQATRSVPDVDAPSLLEREVNRGFEAVEIVAGVVLVLALLKFWRETVR